MTQSVKSKNIYEASFPYYCLMKISGFVPFSYVGPVNKGVFTITLWDFFYCAVVLCLHILVVLVTYWRNFEIFTVTALVNKVSQLEIYSSLAIGVVNTGIQYLKQNEIRHFLKVIDKFDREVILFELKF
jgi:hypothetical protein